MVWFDVWFHRFRNSSDSLLWIVSFSNVVIEPEPSFFQVNNDRSRKNFEGVENRNIKFIEKVHYFSILPVLTYLYSSRDKRRSRRKILTINEKCSKKTATFY